MRRRWWIVVVVVLGLTLSAAVAWWALPGVARWAVARQIEAATDRRVTIERFDLDLRSGRLAVAGFRLDDRVAGAPLLEIDRLDPRFVPLALMRGQLQVPEAVFIGLRARVVRTERGDLNIADLLNRPAPTGPAPAVTISRLTVSDGALLVEDRGASPPRIWRAERVAVEAERLSTVERRAS